jgi:predicted TIM-barrel fold metal-dependent hydrolase
VQNQRSANAWRKATSGPVAWGDRLVTGSNNKYFIVSADAHANEPLDLFTSRIKNPEYQDRLPRVVTDAEGIQWLHTDGWPPQRVRIPAERKDLLPQMESFENYEVLAPYAERMEDEDVLRSASARTLEQRLRDNAADGVDAEIVFPQKGILGFATPDPVFAGVMTRAWNRWALETFKPEFHRVMPMALIAAGDLENAIKEVQWAAENGFHGLMVSNRAVFSRVDQPKDRTEYNDPKFEPLWAAIQETGLPLVFHVGNGEDPRAVGGRGAAIIAFHTTMSTAIDPLVTLISSGVLERFPNLKVGVIEAGAGWIPWVLNTMDHGYRAHHMWVRPVIPELPSFYFKRNCFASTLEHPGGLEHLCAMGLEDNLLWSSDYPHHEGSFPYSKLSIEREMKNLDDTQRTKILGANAVEFFNIDEAKVRASQSGAA